MRAGPDTPGRGDRPGVGTRPRTDDREPDGARRITFTIALVVTVAFLLVTAAGAGWLLSDGGPLTGSSAAEEDGADREEAREEAPEDPGGTVSGDGDTVTDSRSRLAYELPGQGWRRLGDDEVPTEYSSYTVYGPAEDPDAVIVTGTEDLTEAEPIAVTGVRTAVDMAADLVTEGEVWAQPSGETDVDGLPAFGASMGSDPGDAYGRFLILELDGDRGAFMLGLNTDGGAEATEGIDAAFDSVGTL